MGLEGISEWPSGDGATYSELGDEVVKAVQGITASYPAIDSVVLIGHSRGGLSARSAVNKEDASVSKIKGVLTIGTPHQGSAFGRLYSWLEKYPSSKALINYSGPSVDEKVTTWDLVWTLGVAALDLRSPSVNFLAIGSTEIQKLNSVKLPTNIKYGAIASNNLKFGKLASTFWGYVLIDVLWVLPTHPTKWLLDGKNEEDYKGDGIVHRASQDIPGVTFSKLTNDLDGVLHRDEPTYTAAIEVVLREMMK